MGTGPSVVYKAPGPLPSSSRVGNNAIPLSSCITIALLYQPMSSCSSSLMYLTRVIVLPNRSDEAFLVQRVSIFMVHAPREVVTSIMVVKVGEIVLALIVVRLILIVN